MVRIRFSQNVLWLLAVFVK